MKPLGPGSRSLALALAVVCACLVSFRVGGTDIPAASAQSSEPEVWFGPYPSGYGPPALRPDFGAPDYMDLFSDAAPWANARDRLDVFQFYPGWLLQAPDEHIATAVAFLNSHGIRIAIEAPALTYQWASNGDPQTCGQGGEGWDNDSLGWTLTIIGRVQAAGGVVEFITMQEPYASASATTAAPFPISCAWNVTQIANHVKLYVEGVRAVYPGIRFGDVESDHATAAEIAAWADAFAAAVGEPLAYMHWDVDWNFRSDWPERARQLETLMGARGIPFGMIYNGIEDDTSSAQWNSHALEHAARYEGEQGGQPAHVKFQSWHRYPQQMLPETDPAAMTSLINRYFEARTATSLSIGPPSGTARTATVTTTAAGASVEVRYRVMDGPGVEATYRITGVVPAGAAQAIVGYRVNMECNCGFKESYFTLYEGNYRQASTEAGVAGAANRVSNPTFATGLSPWHWLPHTASQFLAATTTEPNRVRVEAPNGEWAMINSGWFNVTAGQFFEARFRAKVDPRAIGSGYFTIVFATGGFAEVHRYRLPIEPALLVATGVTDGTGTAMITLPDLPPARLHAQAVVAAGPGRLTGFSPLGLAGALVPDVTSTVPAALAAGAPGQQVRVLGSGLNWDSTAAWDGNPRSALFVNGGELRVTLTAADLASAGPHALTVSTPGPGGGSDSFTFTLAERTLTLSGAAAVNEGATYTLNLSASYPGSNTINRWTINWGDGQVQVVNGNPPSVSHVYADGPNSYTITATARDTDGTWPASNAVAVTVNNVAPAISVTGVASVAEGSAYNITFAASDPGADTIVEWTVDWGDGSPAGTFAGGATGASHVYANGPATHTIQVSARDEDGTFLATPRQVSVTNVAPTVTISGPTSAVAGVPYTLVLSVSDPGQETPVAWVIDWGDGAESVLAGTATSATHTYAEAPAFPQVRATFEDGDGVFASNTVNVTVFNQAPPIAITGPATVDEGSLYSLTLAGNEPFIQSWTIDWGDGSEETVPISGGLPTTVSHVYADGPAAFTITASATDGLSTWEATPVEVMVLDVAPEISVSAPASVDEGSQVTVIFAATDPGDDPVLQWRVDWGDGSESVLLGSATSASHTYADGPATRHAVVTLVNGDGSFSAPAAVIEVFDVPPAVSASGPPTVDEGATYSISLSAVDPGTDATSWRIDWGDGTIDQAAAGATTATHVYDDDGNYAVTVTALQGEAEFPAGTWPVTVLDVPPAVTLTAPASVREFNPLTITFAASDPGDDTVSHWTVDWGDETDAETLEAGASEATHAYQQGGVSRTVTLTVHNEDGSWSQQRTVQVLPGPILAASGPAAVDQGATYTLTISASPAVLTGWSIDWGDGTVQSIAGTATEAEHVYTVAPATRTIRVSGTDSYGTWQANELTVEVRQVRRLVFQAQPDGGEAGQPFAVQPVVAIVDGTGAVDTSDNETEVTLSLAGGEQLHCSEGLSRRMAAGVAVFDGCAAFPGGTGLILRVTAGPSLEAVASEPFDLASPAPWNSYFAEGFTGNGWSTRVHLFNPTHFDQRVELRYLPDGSQPVVRFVHLPPWRQTVIDAADVTSGPGPDVAFGLQVVSPLALVVEQSMQAGERGDFGHSTNGAPYLASEWLFAEGFTRFTWQTFVLLANPGTEAATVDVTYQVQPEPGQLLPSVVTVTVDLLPGRRATLVANDAVPDAAFSVQVSATQPIVAEMAMYDPATGMAHRTIGTTEARTAWLLGEGFTGAAAPGFNWETYISVGNPGETPAAVTVEFILQGEPPVTRELTVQPRSRETFIAQTLESGVGPGRAFGARVTATAPIVVQQVMIDPSTGAARAMSSMASSAPGARWGLAGGSSEPGQVTFLTVSNTGADDLVLQVDFYFNDETPPERMVVDVPGNERVTVIARDHVPPGKTFGMVLSAADGAVIVQQSTFDEARGRAFGTLATALPP